MGAWVGFSLSAVGWSIGFLLGIPYVLFYPLSRPKNICPGVFFLICGNARVFCYLFLKSSAYFNDTKIKKIPLLFIEVHNCYTVLSVSEYKNVCSSVELRNVSENVRRGNTKELELWEKHA